MKRIGILSDTHGHMDARILKHLEGSDEVWHAGDIGHQDVLIPLREMSVLRAVYGNIDGGAMRRELPEVLTFETEGLRVYMTHIAGTPGKYPTKVREGIASFGASIMVCGHSHICLVQPDPRTGVLHMNPGAAGHHGFHKVRTLLRLHADEGRVVHMEVVELGRRGA